MFISFDGTINARDLGGLPLQDGKRVKSGLLLRTAELSTLSDEDIKKLQSLRLARVFDFRDNSECEKSPDREIEGAIYRHISVLPELPDKSARFRDLTPQMLEGTFMEMYRTLAAHEHCAAAYREFFRGALEANGRCLLWHCTQGKDRTGIAAILMLTALGAEKEVILEDYFLSNDGLRPKFDGLRARGFSDREIASLEKVYFVMPRCVNTWFETVEKLYGSPENYLHRALGLSDADMEKLKEYYTE